MITLTATITKLDGSLITLDYNNSLSIERSIFDRSDISMPSWGVISNSGNLQFVDIYGEIRALAEQRHLKSGMEVNLYLNNTVLGISAPVGKFLTNKWDYDNDNKKVSVSIADDLEKWQNIDAPLMGYVPNGNIYISGKYVYNKFHSYTADSYPTHSMLTFDELDAETQQALSNRRIQYEVLDAKTLWSAWQQLCEAFQLHIYKNNLGKVTCKYMGGN